MKLYLIIANAVIFQVGWILSVSFGTPAAVAVSFIALLLYSLYFLDKSQDMFLIVSVVLIGLTVDTFMGSVGVLVYPSGRIFPPFWMVTLWMLFAMTIPWSLNWLVRKKYWFVLFSAIGGPISYFIGVQMSPVKFGFGAIFSAILLATIWAIVGFMIHQITHRWRGRCLAA